MCVFKIPGWLKALPQRLQTKGFSPVWTNLCLDRWQLLLNFAPQIWQTYGFSPVWTLMCSFRACFWTKAFSQISHLNFFGPWYFWCWWKTEALLEVKPHVWQTFKASPFSLCSVLVCLLNSHLLSKAASHFLHLNFCECWFSMWTRKFFWSSQKFIAKGAAIHRSTILLLEVTMERNNIFKS